MKILAIEKELPGVNWNAVDKEILKQEALDIYNLFITDHLREHYFNELKSAVLILECDSIAQAEELLANLPLVKNDLITFYLVELHPYTGYDRIIESKQ